METEKFEAYPLQWPMGYPRTEKPKDGIFKVTFAQAKKEALKQLDLMGARNIVVSTNQPTKKDGLPYANAEKLWANQKDRGVAVYFIWRGQQRVIACDKWVKVDHNMQALAKTIEAMRGLDRWGATDILERAFEGMKALPAPGQASGKPWWEVLNCPSGSSPGVIDYFYKERAKERHPDKGGTREEWDELQEAYRQALAAVKGSR
jgi:hypothetical protein